MNHESGYVELDWETYEPKPPATNAIHVTDGNLDEIAKFFRQNGCEVTRQYSADQQDTLTVRDKDENLVVVISPFQVLVSDGKGTYRAVEYHEFRHSHRKSPTDA